MLTSAADYHLQPTGDIDVSHVPAFLRTDGGPYPLRYGDVLYLVEAFKMSYGFCRMFSDYDHGVLYPYEPTDMPVGLPRIHPVLGHIETFSRREQTGDYGTWRVKPDASTAARNIASGENIYSPFDVPGTKRALTYMPESYYTKPSKTEKWLTLANLRRAWNAIALNRRVFITGRPNVTSEGLAFCSYAKQTDADGNVIAEPVEDLDATFTITGWDCLPSMTVNGVVVMLALGSDSGSSYNLFEYRPVGVTARSPSFRFSFSGDEAKSKGKSYFANALRSVMGGVEWIDVTLNFKHLADG